MAIVLEVPEVDGLGEVLGVLREWQYDGAPMQLHPGDLGWFWQFGAEQAAAAVRVWRQDGVIVAAGLLDGPGLLRLAMAPDLQRDAEPARQVVADVVDPARGVLPAGRVAVEAWACPAVQDELAAHGWQLDEPWTPLRRDLAEPVADPGVRVEVVGPELAEVRAAVHRSTFGSPRFTIDRWRALASGPAYADARCLLAFDDAGAAVAMTTVWSAGPGRPGLIEPMGVHADHRGRGHGRAITVAAAATLRELGSSSAVVNAPSANIGAVAAYASAGFATLPEFRDRCRAA